MGIFSFWTLFFYLSTSIFLLLWHCNISQNASYFLVTLFLFYIEDINVSIVYSLVLLIYINTRVYLFILIFEKQEVGLVSHWNYRLNERKCEILIVVKHFLEKHDSLFYSNNLQYPFYGNIYWRKAHFHRSLMYSVIGSFLGN